MQIPIVMAAFGTTSQAEATYMRIDGQVREAFPGHEIHWAYSSRTIKQVVQSRQERVIRHPNETLQHLHAAGHSWAVVQSVLLTCGHEFHRLFQEIASLDIRSSIGMPLLTAPDDHLRTAGCLEPIIRAHPKKAILLLGHGTDHPCWTTYPAFQQVARQQFGDRIFVGVVEQSPPSQGLIARIIEAGFTEVLLVPLLLVAGRHYINDLMADTPGSWRSRLLAAGLAPEPVAQGVGCLPCIGEIFCDHIREALDVIPA